MFGGSSRFLFSSRKVFGSRLFEMSAPVIGRICSSAKLGSSLITRAQQIAQITSLASDFKNNSLASRSGADCLPSLEETSELLAKTEPSTFNLASLSELLRLQLLDRITQKAISKCRELTLCPSRVGGQFDN